MNNIKKLRLSKGLRQADLASYLNVSQSTLSYWEQGRYDMDNKSLAKLVKYFNVSSDYILGISDNPTPHATVRGHVYDDEALDVIEEMHKRPETKTLFSLTKKATKEDVEAVNELLKHMIGDVDDDDFR